MNSTSLKKVEKYEENPFLPKLMEELQPVKKKKYAFGTNKVVEHNMVINLDGEVLGQTSLYQIEEVDPEPFVKLYKQSMKSFWGLSESAFKVLDYIKENLVPNKDEFYIHVPDVVSFTGYKDERSIFRGLNELVSKKIIAKSVKTNFYFINPTVMFNGDRLVVAKAFVKRKQTKDCNQLDILDAIKEAKGGEI